MTDRLPADDIPSMARWLLARIEQIRHHEAADQIFDEITSAVEACWRTVDRPAADRVYVGSCDGRGATETPPDLEPCGGELFAKQGMSVVRCTVCTYQYDVEERRAWMRESLVDHLGSSTYVAMVCTGLGVRVSASTIRMWVKRNKLQPRTYGQPRTPGGQPRPLYRVGDVIATARKVDEQRAPRSA